MNHETLVTWLRTSVDELQQARGHLRFSFERVGHLSADPADWTDEDLERIEAFTSRFARLVDLLTNKALRAIFRFELESVETMLDRLNLAEKRGFVAKAEDLRVLKEQRNDIAHNYAGSKVADIFLFCRSHTEQLDDICERVTEYANRLLN